MRNDKPEHILRTEAFFNSAKDIRVQLAIDQKRLHDLQSRRSILFEHGCPDDIVLSIRAVENDVHKDIIRLLKAEKNILAVIERVEDPTLRHLLRCFYVNGQTGLQVAETMNYDERTIWRVKHRALEAASRILANNLCDIDNA